MASIQEWLDEEGFDWLSGKVIVQEVGDHLCPGWATPPFLSAREAVRGDSLLVKDFYDGYGGPKCPRFIAEDIKRICFPYQYDGATGLVVIEKDITKYLNIKNKTPYPGG